MDEFKPLEKAAIPSAIEKAKHYRLLNEPSASESIYYTGISHERRGMARLRSGSPGAGSMAFECFKEAMEWYEKAEKIAPLHNNDPMLRWNTCTRLIERNRLEPMPKEEREPFLE